MHHRTGHLIKTAKKVLSHNNAPGSTSLYLLTRRSLSEGSPLSTSPLSEGNQETKSIDISPTGASNSDSSSPLWRLKHPSRGGQDLSKRYLRLARSVRGKEKYARSIEEYEEDAMEDSSPESNSIVSGSRRDARLFHGFIVPEEPIPPGPDECCMSGCAICVHDLFQESLEAYTLALQTLQNSLRKAGIPESEWPEDIRPRAGKKKNTQKGVVLSVFEQFELALAAKEEKVVRAAEKEEMKKEREKLIPRGRKVKTSTTKFLDMKVGEAYEALSWVVFSRK